MKYTKPCLPSITRLLTLSLAVLLLGGCSLLVRQPKLDLDYAVSADLGDLMRRMSGYSRDSLFNAAVQQADKEAEDDEVPFMESMARTYRARAAEGKLAPVFAALPRYSGSIRATEPNDKVLKVLDESLAQEMDHVVKVLLKRIDCYGLRADENVRMDYVHGTVHLHLKAFDEKDIPHINRLLSTQGKLEMYETYENEELINDLVEADKALGKLGIKVKDNSPQKSKAPSMAEKLGLPDSIVQRSKQVDKAVEDSINRNPLLKILSPRADNQNGIFPGAAIGVSFGKDTGKVNTLMNIALTLMYFPRDVKFLWASKPVNTSDVYELYAIRFNPAMPSAPIGNDAITDARMGHDASGLADVTITMNVVGSSRWEQMTQSAAYSSMSVNGRVKEVHRCVAMVIDDKVFSAPRVMNKIIGGNTQITGLGSEQEAVELAAILKAGSTRCRLHILEEKSGKGK